MNKTAFSRRRLPAPILLGLILILSILLALSASSSVPPASAQSVTLAAIAITGAEARLILTGHTENWWFKEASDPHCESTTGTTADVPPDDGHGHASFTPGTAYTYTAYSDNTCSTTLASVTFTTPSLAVSNVTATSATLTFKNYISDTGNWYYEYEYYGPFNISPGCHGPVRGATVNLTGLLPKAEAGILTYSDSACTKSLRVSKRFITSSLAVSGVTGSRATLWTTGPIGAGWHYQADNGPDATVCRGPVAGHRAPLEGLTSGVTYAYTAYSDAACSSRIDEPVSFTTFTNPSVCRSLDVSFEDQDVIFVRNEFPARLSFSNGSADAFYDLSATIQPLVLHANQEETFHSYGTFYPTAGYEARSHYEVRWTLPLLGGNEVKLSVPLNIENPTGFSTPELLKGLATYEAVHESGARCRGEALVWWGTPSRYISTINSSSIDRSNNAVDAISVDDRYPATDGSGRVELTIDYRAGNLYAVNCLKLDLPAGLTRDTAIPLVLVEDLRYAGRPAPQTNPPHLVYDDDGHDEHFTPCSGSGGKFAGGMVKYLGPPKFGRAYYAVTLPLKVSGSVDDLSSQCVTAQVFSSPKPEKDPPSLNWITGTGTPVEGWRNDTASSCLGPPDTSLGPPLFQNGDHVDLLTLYLCDGVVKGSGWEQDPTRYPCNHTQASDLGIELAAEHRTGGETIVYSAPPDKVNAVVRINPVDSAKIDTHWSSVNTWCVGTTLSNCSWTNNSENISFSTGRPPTARLFVPGARLYWTTRPSNGQYSNWGTIGRVMSVSGLPAGGFSAIPDQYGTKCATVNDNTVPSGLDTLVSLGGTMPDPPGGMVYRFGSGTGWIYEQRPPEALDGRSNLNRPRHKRWDWPITNFVKDDNSYLRTAEFDNLGTYVVDFHYSLTRATGTERYCDTTRAVFHVGPVSDLSVSDPGERLDIADGTAWTILARNEGPDPAERAVVTVTLPAGASVSSYEASHGSYANGQWILEDFIGVAQLTLFPAGGSDGAATASIAHDNSVDSNGDYPYTLCLFQPHTTNNSNIQVVRDSQGQPYANETACKAHPTTNYSGSGQWFSGPVLDHRDGNNTATIAARAPRPRVQSPDTGAETFAASIGVNLNWPVQFGAACYRLESQDEGEGNRFSTLALVDDPASNESCYGWTAATGTPLRHIPGATTVYYTDTTVSRDTTRHYRIYPLNAAGEELGDRYLQTSATTDNAGVVAYTVVRTEEKIYAYFRESALTLRVAENSPAGTPVGAPVTVLHSASNPATYSLSGPDRDLFDIDATTGQITVAEGTALDYEGEKASYTLTVVADPAYGIDPEATVTIALVDLPEVSITPTGQPKAGTALTAALSHSGGTPTDLAWQWSRSSAASSWLWIPISGANTASYTPTPQDAGRRLLAVAAWTGASGRAATAEAATASLAGDLLPDPVTATVSISPSGQPQEGTALTASLSLAGGGPDSVAWQWSRSSSSGGWNVIAGATNPGYTPTELDAGRRLRAVATYTATREGGSVTGVSGAVTPALAGQSVGLEQALDAINAYFEGGANLEETYAALQSYFN